MPEHKIRKRQVYKKKPQNKQTNKTNQKHTPKKEAHPRIKWEKNQCYLHF